MVFSLPLRTRFRGITVREGLLVKGDVRWAEWSPFWDYDHAEAKIWWQATREIADEPFPEPVRDVVNVNSTIPAVPPQQAYDMAVAAGCQSAKVKVAEPGEPFSADLERVEAVRDALGTQGKIRIDANGKWSRDQALVNLRALARFELEYVEQPCETIDEMAQLRISLARNGIDVLVAADESIRRSGDPERVAAMAAADIAVLKVQPLGGVKRCLQLAETLKMPVVVSSALESSVGLRAGLALAAALPQLPYACGLNTANLLTRDVTAAPLVAQNGVITLRDVAISDKSLWEADPMAVARWKNRQSALS